MSCKLQNNVNDSLPKDISSETSYFKNTLSYPVKVQALYYSMNVANKDQWYKNTPVPYSDPVLINPGEVKLIMDYIRFDQIKIYRASDNKLLNDEYGNYLTDFKFIPGEKKDGEALYIANDYPVKGVEDSKYLTENLPWDEYAFGCYIGSDIEDLDYRKSIYISGVSSVLCYNMNPDYIDFQ